MPEKNKKTSGDEQCDCKQNEREKQDRAKDEHPAGHLRIGAEDEWDGTEEHDAAPATSFRGALRRDPWNLGRIGCGSYRRRRGAGRPEEERQEKSEEDEQDPEECQRAGPDDGGDDEDEIDARFPAGDGHGEGDQSHEQDPGSHESDRAHATPILGVL